MLLKNICFYNKTLFYLFNLCVCRVCVWGGLKLSNAAVLNLGVATPLGVDQPLPRGRRGSDCECPRSSAASGGRNLHSTGRAPGTVLSLRSFSAGSQSESSIGRIRAPLRLPAPQGDGWMFYQRFPLTYSTCVVLWSGMAAADGTAIEGKIGQHLNYYSSAICIYFLKFI